MTDRCPSMNPEGGLLQCRLPDLYEAHLAGHESPWVEGSRSSWATRPEDHERWVPTAGRPTNFELPDGWFVLWDNDNFESLLWTTDDAESYGTVEGFYAARDWCIRQIDEVRRVGR